MRADVRSSTLDFHWLMMDVIELPLYEGLVGVVFRIEFMRYTFEYASCLNDVSGSLTMKVSKLDEFLM